MEEVTLEGSSADSQAVPRRIGPYTILRRIGAGGMGTVYEALQAQPERRVALKFIRSDQMSDELLHRFAIEIQALGRLRHAGIARIYEGGTAQTDSGAWPYFVMELVDGVPLDEYVAKERISIRECVTLMVRVAEAVHHAHQQDVIHRDLKPANILVEKTGEPKILDFGVARVISKGPMATAHTQAGVLLGTLPYMSPEQTAAHPDEFDERSDVYALGVITYKLLAGQLPYKFHGGYAAVLDTIREAIPVSLGDIDERLRGDLEAVVTKALSKERKNRYQSAQDFADDLRRVLQGQPISAAAAGPAAKIRRWTMREESIRQAGWTGVVGFVGLSLFMFVYLILAIVARFWWSPALPRDLRYADFMANTALWTILLAFLAYVHWRITRRHLPFMWLAFAGSIALAVFTTAVLFGLSSYDFGGVLRNPVVRVSLYLIFTALAYVDVFVTLLALVTAYQLQRWDQPVAEKRRGGVVSPT